MSLASYNDAQVKEIKAYIRRRGGDPDSPQNTIWALQWIKKYSKRFRQLHKNEDITSGERLARHERS